MAAASFPNPSCFRSSSSVLAAHGLPLLNPCISLRFSVPAVSLPPRLHHRPVTKTAALPVVSGIPILGPLLNLVLSPGVLLLIYLAGIVRFWAGFSKTVYSSSQTTKLGLTALWPVLFVTSKDFRRNFKKAVQ